MSEQTSASPRPSPVVIKKPSPASGKRIMTIFWVILIVVLIVLSFLWFWQTRLSGYDKNWQAVFLSNGQVYFGQVEKSNSSEVVMIDIYYLQVTRPLQQTQDGEQPANPQGELSLVKLGNELHRPTDKMYINRDHVLFIEDLKDDSNVVQAIINYKNGQ